RDGDQGAERDHLAVEAAGERGMIRGADLRSHFSPEIELIARVQSRRIQRSRAAASTAYTAAATAAAASAGSARGAPEHGLRGFRALRARGGIDARQQRGARDPRLRIRL